MEARVEYVLKRPGKEKGRNARRFSILRKVINADGTFVYQRIQIPELEKLNLAFLAGVHDYAYAEARATEIRKHCYQENRSPLRSVAHCPENLKLVDRYFKEAYGNRDLVDPESEYNALNRAVRCLGSVPLLTSSEKKIQDAVDLATKGDPNRYRRVSQKLNQIGKHFGTNIKLRKKREAYTEPAFLSMEQFKDVEQKLVTDWFRILCWIGFTTGCRVGEIFALRPEDFNEKLRILVIRRQMDTEGRFRDTKNRKIRRLPVIKDGTAWLARWFDVDVEERKRLRLQYSTKFSLWLKQCCHRAKIGKEVRFHDLRHSYAKFLIDRGASVDLVADCIGDDVRVAKKHYIGWLLSDSSMERLSLLTR